MSDGTTRVMINTRLDPGVQLNDTYEIDERIASGGMGEVYRGHNIQTGEPVAIKAILPELADKEAITALFKREATTLGRLHHDTIVRYYSFSRDPRLGRTYLAMEFVEGVSLADRISRVPLTPDEVRKLFAKVADGLALAHEARVIHRDLSPDNIILRGGNVGRPTIIDFGIARNANVGEGTLIGGGFAGKFNFVSPEQLGIHNREVDARSDIYSLGLVIAAALRGDPLDMGGSHVEVIEKRSRLPDLSGIDEGLRPLVEAMLQPNPDDRPADATVVADWLRATANNGQTAAPANGGLAASTGAPDLTFPTQPGIAAAARPTGVPFAASQGSAAASNPTQLIAPAALPFSPARPPSGSGESPFGTPPAPAAALIGPATQPPSGPSPVVSATQSKSGIGRYAIAGGVLLLLAAGGGAYMTGLIGPKGGDSDGKGTVEQTDRDTDLAKDGTTNQETVKDGAKSEEHDNIGKAIEETLGSDGVTGTGDTKTSNSDSGGIKTESGGTDTGSEGSEGSTTGTDGTKTTTGTETTGDGKIETVSGDSSQGDGTQTTSDGTGGTETIGKNNTGSGEVTGPDNGIQETTSGLTKMVDVGVAWLRHYDGGPCFFVTVTSVTDKTLMAKGFGLDTPAFKKFYNSFKSANDFDPVINGHPIRQPQCAAVDFLKAVQPVSQDNPRLHIASDKLKTGDTLNVSVDEVGSRKLDLLLVDAEGFVHNMKSFAKETDADGKSIFDIRLGGNKLDPDSPQMVIALTSPSGLAVPEGTKQVDAAELFPRLGREVEVMKSSVGVDFGYFRLSP